MLTADSKGGTAILARERTAPMEKPSARNKVAPKHLPVIDDGVSRRESLVVSHMSLVRRLAAKFRYSGEPLEDLIQVGNLGLVKAARKFDADRGTSFASFAVPVIMGEIKNYFRDHGWSVKLPRKLQTHKRLVNKAADILTQNLGRSPTMSELAQVTGISVEEVHQTFELDALGRPMSLDLEYEPGEGGDNTTLMDYIGSVDPEIENRADVLDLSRSIGGLNQQEKKTLYLRYHNGLSQSETAALMGVSQMQVSRLQRNALAKLRDALQGQAIA